jgi:plasmid stabilization system protein ParE
LRASCWSQATALLCSRAADVQRRSVLVYRILPSEVVDILRIWHAAQDRPGSL